MIGLYTSFRIDGMAGSTNFPKYPSGLFLLICAADESDGDEPSDPSVAELAFCGPQGQAHDLSAVINPWRLLHPGRLTVEQKKSLPAREFVKQPYFFCAIAHPSADLARSLLKRAQQGRDIDDAGTAFPWQKLEPEKLSSGALVFKLSGDKAKFIPSGADRYGGWMLYFGMPYALLPDVRSQVRKLSVDLGKLRYPVGANQGGTHAPYPASSSECDSEFGRAVQCCVHRFQEEASVGTAKQPAGQGVPSSWEAIAGKEVALTQLTGHEAGVVDRPTAASLETWLERGVVRPGDPLVKDGNLWGDMRLWWRQWALEDFCKTLGGVYQPVRGSSYRKLAQTGGGQASQSKHKLGMAFDLNAYEAEPAERTPFGVEADYEAKGAGDGKTYRPRWLIFLHSTLDLESKPSDLAGIQQQLEALPGRVRDKMKAHMGKALGAEAEAFLASVSALVSELVQSARKVGAGNTGTELANNFFRTSIRRFQWRENEDDGGDVQDKEVDAATDAQANRLDGATNVRSWLNYSRLAYRLGLYSIGARSDFCPPGFKEDHSKNKRAIRAVKLRPGSTPSRVQKATVLDRIADGIENMGANGVIKVYGPDDASFVVGESATNQFLAKDFDLDTIRDWIRRPSDDPEGLPPASIGFSYANNGLDLTITLMTSGPAKQARKAFFDARKTLRAEIVALGAGLEFKKRPELFKAIDLEVVAQLIEQASVRSPLPPVKKGDPGPLDIVIRPRVYRPNPVQSENSDHPNSSCAATTEVLCGHLSRPRATFPVTRLYRPGWDPQPRGLARAKPPGPGSVVSQNDSAIRGATSTD